MNELYEWFTPTISWFLLGLAFLLIELAVPSFVLIFFGVGSWVTMFVCMFFDPSLEIQLLLFSVSSVATLLVFRNRLRDWFSKEEPVSASLGGLELEFVGKTSVVTETVGPHGGRVHFNGTDWKAESDEIIEKGISVIIISKTNMTLNVKPL